MNVFTRLKAAFVIGQSALNWIEQSTAGDSELGKAISPKEAAQGLAIIGNDVGAMLDEPHTVTFNELPDGEGFVLVVAKKPSEDSS